MLVPHLLFFLFLNFLGEEEGGYITKGFQLESGMEKYSKQRTTSFCVLIPIWFFTN